MFQASVQSLEENVYFSLSVFVSFPSQSGFLQNEYRESTSLFLLVFKLQLLKFLCCIQREGKIPIGPVSSDTHRFSGLPTWTFTNITQTKPGCCQSFTYYFYTTNKKTKPSQSTLNCGAPKLYHPLSGNGLFFPSLIAL